MYAYSGMKSMPNNSFSIFSKIVVNVGNLSQMRCSHLHTMFLPLKFEDHVSPLVVTSPVVTKTQHVIVECRCPADGKMCRG